MKYNCSTLLLLLLSIYSFAQAPSYSVPVHDSTSKGYYFLSTLSSGPSTSLKKNLIFDSKGNLVYYQPFPKGASGTDFKIQPNGLISYFTNNQFYILDSTFKKVDSIKCQGGYIPDLHELQILPNGNYLLLAEETVTMDLSGYPMFNGKGSFGSSKATVTAGLIQELDKSKKVVFEWHAKDHFAFDDVDDYWLSSPSSVDWTHFNALELDKDGNILISSRHFNEITKINHSDGSIIWRLGGKNNQFTFSNDSFPFYGQHDIRRIANGHITLYDDGNHNIAHGARGVEYDIDETKKTAKLVWSYMYDSSMFAFATGNVQRLSNGNTLVNFGLINKNKVCFAVVDSNRNKIFELDLNNGLFSYRSFNYLSLPWKLNRPKVTKFDSNGITYLAADSGYSSYLWNTGSTSRIIPLSATGTYAVFVPYGIGYISSENIDINYNPCKLKAAISGNLKVCGSSTQSYIATGNVGTPTHYWKVNGGAIISGQSTDTIQIKWASTGSGDLTLIEYNSAGCTDSTISAIVINPLPVASIKGSDALCTNYFPAYDAELHSGSNYFWKIKGGNITAGQNTSSLSAKWTTTSGSLTLLETSQYGCVDSTVKSITIYKAPSATISGNDKICKGNTVQYISTYDPNAYYNWNITGGTILSGQNSDTITVSWPNSGAGSVNLAVVNTSGCADSNMMSTTINELPKAMFKSNNVCLGQGASFIDSTNIETVTYQWNFGDGASSTSSNPSHNYKESGTYEVDLTVTTPEGCSDSNKSNITIYPLPVAHWVATNIKRSYTFKADDSLQAATYAWDFGDGGMANTFHEKHQYALDGKYNVRLTVNSTQGCQANYDSALIVNTSSILAQNKVIGSLSIYPNPSAQYFNIQYTITDRERVNISVFDMQGKEIIQLINATQEAGTYSNQVDAVAHNLQAGMYMLHITIGSEMISKPAILTR